jgi:hypothetical protein
VRNTRKVEISKIRKLDDEEKAEERKNEADKKKEKRDPVTGAANLISRPYKASCTP